MGTASCRIKNTGGRGIMLAATLAFWPVWGWYVSATMDASNDYWGLLALASAILVVARNKSPSMVRLPLALPAAFVAFYLVATLAEAPISIRAVLAFLALGSLASAWRLGKRIDLPLHALLMLALPLTATWQFYLGYPLRVAAGALSAALLQMNGIAVVREGALLNWADQIVSIDAPCSGVKMLWAAMYMVYTLSAFHRLSCVQTGCAIAFAVATVVAANAIRAAALFYMETGMLNLPRWAHDATGMFSFAIGACAILWGIRQIKGGRTWSSAVHAGS
ncbi:MAG: hypothetical protein A3I66_19580 [Burkholderiales bacterium RIFCSPLOWO2_02_FULL_57_36]|nr:MAG: hypothetical protein A3I66_19580 [Burkholderiales bacterium RIFCSPLOWO2_02_FULL_57_36]